MVKKVSKASEVTKSNNKTELHSGEGNLKTRFLLMLWDLGGTDAEVKKGELTRRLKPEQYKSATGDLEKSGDISITLNKRTALLKLTSQGKDTLQNGLKSNNFSFESQIGARTANALLKWMRQIDTAVGTTNGKVAPAVESSITSYETFKPVVLELYDRLNRDYNFDHLVPIYRIRREVGDRVSRVQFDEWSLKMQANDIWQLIGGEMPEMTPDKSEDSITTKLGAIRYYVKRIS